MDCLGGMAENWKVCVCSVRFCSRAMSSASFLVTLRMAFGASRDAVIRRSLRSVLVASCGDACKMVAMRVFKLIVGELCGKPKGMCG